MGFTMVNISPGTDVGDLPSKSFNQKKADEPTGKGAFGDGLWLKTSNTLISQPALRQETTP